MRKISNADTQNATVTAVEEAAVSENHRQLVKFCYYAVSTKSFFDFTEFEPPVPLTESTIVMVTVVPTTPVKDAVTLLELEASAWGNMGSLQPSLNVATDTGALDQQLKDAGATVSSGLKAGGSEIAKGTNALKNLVTPKQPAPSTPPPPPEDDPVPPPPPPPLASVSPSPSTPPNVITESVDAFGSEYRYFDGRCATWKLPTPDESTAMGYTFEPKTAMGRPTSVEVHGQLYSFEKTSEGSIRRSNGNVTIKWMLVHSVDGSNMNYRTLNQGQAKMINGTFDGLGQFEGLSIYGKAPRFASGSYIALWLDVVVADTNTEAEILVCDNLQYVIEQSRESALTPQQADCPRCSRDPVQDSVIRLELEQPTTP